MPKHTYRPIGEAPLDGTPIVAVCGGVEMAVAYDDGGFPSPGWYYFDEDEGGTTYERVRSEISKWREMPW